MNYHLKGNPNKVKDWLLMRNKARKQQNNIFKMFKEKKCQPRLLCPAKLPFKNKGEIKTFHNQEHLKESPAIRPCKKYQRKFIRLKASDSRQ